MLIAIVVLLPIAVGMPSLVVGVPPAVIFLPAAIALRVQVTSALLSLMTPLTMLLDCLVKSRFRVFDPSLTIAMIIRQEPRSGRQHSYAESGRQYRRQPKSFQMLNFQSSPPGPNSDRLLGLAGIRHGCPAFPWKPPSLFSYNVLRNF